MDVAVKQWIGHVCAQHANISVGLEEWKTCTHELLGGSILMPF